jgi:hypothetical protein
MAVMGQSVSDPALLSCLLFLLQGIDQFDRGEEPYSLPMVLDGLHGYRGCQMGFARTRPAHKHHILGIFQELAPVQRFHQGLINGTLPEVEASQIPVGRELGQAVNRNIAEGNSFRVHALGDAVGVPFFFAGFA